MNIEEKLDSIQKDITEIRVVLKGYNGNPGLCDDVSKVKEDFYKFKRWILVVVAFLLGASGFSIVEFVKVLAK